MAPPLFHAAFEHAAIDGNDAKAIMELSGSPEAKSMLQAATEEAVSRGSFGSPTVFVESGAVQAAREASGKDFMVFGSDRMEQLAWGLGLKWTGPNPPVE